MSELWFIADTHFNHSKIIEFEPVLRPFGSIEEHDEALIDRWNAKVRPSDIVWHLGDVAFGNKEISLNRVMPRLNGRKRLIMGNHDTPSLMTCYRQHFEWVGGALFMPISGDRKILLTHIPVHPGQLEYRAVANVHGHVHSNGIADPRYINISAEAIDLAPVTLEQILCGILEPTP